VISIRPAELNEWRAYRDVRLQALLDSPNAFGSTYEEEADRTDANWAARIAAATSSGRDRVLFARVGESVCGLVWCKLSSAEPRAANVFQMWVDAASRGMGAGRALLEGAIDWAERVGARQINLGVTAAETPAMRLYLACGFRPAGELEPLRESSGLLVQPMSLVVGSATRSLK
jgi:GNAT superfamily N-acetyltransferase